MMIVRFVLAAGIALGFTMNDVRADVRVVFHHPESYTDAGLHREYGAKARDATLTELRTYLERLGERYLTADQTLTIDVEDVDLAGRYTSWRSYQPRVLTDVTWPKIAVRFTLSRDGTTLASGAETIRDMNYLMRVARNRVEPLPYEKAMLEDWFKSRVMERHPITE